MGKRNRNKLNFISKVVLGKNTREYNLIKQCKKIKKAEDYYEQKTLRFYFFNIEILLS